jgi:hypothetical protein
MAPFIVQTNFPLFKMTNERNLEKRKDENLFPWLPGLEDEMEQI